MLAGWLRKGFCRLQLSVISTEPSSQLFCREYQDGLSLEAKEVSGSFASTRVLTTHPRRTYGVGRGSSAVHSVLRNMQRPAGSWGQRT